MDKPINIADIVRSTEDKFRSSILRNGLFSKFYLNDIIRVWRDTTGSFVPMQRLTVEIIADIYDKAHHLEAFSIERLDGAQQEGS